MSTLGNVRSVDRCITRSDGRMYRRRGKPKTLKETADGYCCVGLNREGVCKNIPVHRLVALVFLDSIPDKAEVNHRDFDRKNNRVENLEWVTHAENIAHTVESGRHVSCRDLRGENNPNYGNKKLKEKYLSDPKLSMEKQSRPRERNGMSKKVKLVNGVHEATFPYIGACADYLISAGIKGKRDNLAIRISERAKSGKQYRGYRFEFV